MYIFQNILNKECGGIRLVKHISNSLTTFVGVANSVL